MSKREWRLRGVKALRPNPSKLIKDVLSRSSAALIFAERLLRILVRDPWDDYEPVRNLHQMLLAKRKNSAFKLVTIQKICCVNPIEQSQILSNIRLID